MLLTQSPSTQHPSHWRFAAVDGALCRLEHMGARAVLLPLQRARSELEDLVEGFQWETLQSLMTQALPGGKGRNLREMGRFQRGSCLQHLG